MASIKELYIPFKGHKTYVRIVGEEYHKTPLVFLHGGPGSTHNAFELLDDVADLDKRPLIMYDQIGCGLSSLKNEDSTLYNKETWVEELINLRNYLNLKNIHLIGHSWGGMLAIIYLCDYFPKGIKSVALSSTLASASLWEKETNKIVKTMSKKDQDILYRAFYKNEKVDYEEALQRYYDLCVFSKPDDSSPECLKRNKISGEVAYVTGWGKCEFKPTGNLKDYEYLDKLKNINCPVLIMHGENDESTFTQNKAIFDNIIVDKKLITISKARHRTFYENHQEYIDNLIEFLDKND